jgi:hypothetical protein
MKGLIIMDNLLVLVIITIIFIILGIGIIYYLVKKEIL